MENAQANQPLTPELIRHLLANAAHFTAFEAEPTPLMSTYRRLMEIYCVIKAGGIEAQREVAHRLEATERAALLAEIQTLAAQPSMESRVRALQQEIWELEQSVASRLNYLDTIDVQEAAIVQRCLPEIDAYFKALGPSR